MGFFACFDRSARGPHPTSLRSATLPEDGEGEERKPMSDDFLKNPTSLFDIKGQTAIVTGASGAFGSLAAKVLAGAGANVVLHCHRSRTEAEFLAARLQAARPASCAVIQGDLLDFEGLPRLVQAAGEAFGRLDGDDGPPRRVVVETQLVARGSGEVAPR